MTDTLNTQVLCWVLTRRDGVIIRGTSLDRDLVVTAGGYAGTYLSSSGVTGSGIRSGSDLSTDNLEVSGLQVTSLVDAGAIASGLFDAAQVTIFQVDFNNTATVTVLQSGIMGQIVRQREGGFRTEIRGLTEILSQAPLKIYQSTCRAELGSGAEVPVIERCGVNLATYLRTGAIVSVITGNRQFTVDTLTDVTGWYDYGVMKFTSGANNTFGGRIKAYTNSAGVKTISLLEPLPYNSLIGDTFTVTPGCNKLYIVNADKTIGGDCKVKFNNLINFRGDPLIPGMDDITRIGKGAAGK